MKIPTDMSLLASIQTEINQLRLSLLDLDCNESMLTDLRRLITSGGKRLRPILALLTYRMGNDRIYPILPLMCMLELMHTASLIHDDIVDNASLRRGAATINAASGATAAVGAGDFLLAKAMENLHYYKGSGINEALVCAAEEMCLGEILGLRVRFEHITREQYFLQIRRKTAGLIAAACFTGAVAGGLSESESNLLRIYGENLGVAFQLCDDLLDFSDNNEFGKQPGQDLRNGVFTLPILYLLEAGIPDSVKNQLLNKNKSQNDIDRLILFIRSTDAFDHTKIVIRQKAAEAVRAMSCFPESKEKNALIGLASGLAARHA